MICFHHLTSLFFLSYVRFHPSGGDPCFVRLRVNGHDLSKILLDESLDLAAARALLLQPCEEVTSGETRHSASPAPAESAGPNPTSRVTTASLVYPPIPTTTLVAYMSQFDALDSFYVQPVDRLDALTSLAEALNDRYDQLDAAALRLPQEAPVEVGDVVCARWSEDDHWYRARVKEVQENIVRVRKSGKEDWFYLSPVGIS